MITLVAIQLFLVLWVQAIANAAPMFPACGVPATVATSAGIKALRDALAECAGGELTAQVTGALVVTAPLVVAQNTQLTVIGAAGASISGAGLVRVFEVQRGATLIVESIGLVHGAALGLAAGADAGAFDGDGGLIYAAANSMVALTHCTLTHGTAAMRGGAIASSGDVVVAGCIFADNTAGRDGGAIAIDGGSLKSTDTDFLHNVCEKPAMASNMTDNSIGCFAEVLNKGVYNDDCSNAKVACTRILHAGPANDGVNDQVANTPEECNRQCQGYTYAGVQWGQQCFCGDKVFPSEHVPMDMCRLPDFQCTGNQAGRPTQYCGGSRTMELFTVFQYPLGGGAVVATNGARIAIAGGTLNGNRAFLGGAVALVDADATIVNAAFERNAARILGGAISATGATTTGVEVALNVAGTSFTANSCPLVEVGGSDGFLGGSGGAVGVTGAASSATMRDCTFDHNAAAMGGAVSASGGSQLLLERSVFTANEAVWNVATCARVCQGLVKGGALFISDMSITQAQTDIKAPQRVRIVACNFLDGFSAWGAGAIYAGGGSMLHIEESRIVNNSAYRTCGAMCFDGAANVTLVASLVSLNRLEHNLTEDATVVSWDRSAAAIFVSGSDDVSEAQPVLSVRDSNISGNACEVCEGGAFKLAHRASASLIDTVVAANSAKQGGGFFVEYSSWLHMEGGALLHNTAVLGAAIIMYIDSKVDLDSVVAEENVADDFGGVLCMKGQPEMGANMAVQRYGGGTSRFTARNSRFSRNRATILGGAFYVFGATAQLFNCTVEDNTATGGSGGGVYVGLNSTLEVIGSRLWRNEAGQGDGGALCFDGTMYSKDGDLHAYFYTGNSSDYPITVTITDTSIVKNRAADAGGGIYAVTTVDLTMRNVSSKGNAAAAQAPAFYISDNSVATFDFCSFTGEITDEGPVMFVGASSTFSATALQLSYASGAPRTALQVSDTSSRFTCVGCTFDGWDSGATPVIATAGELKLLNPDFTASTSPTLVVATVRPQPLPPLARIVNAALSTGSYATALSAAAASALANEGGANTTVDSAEPHLVTGAATCAQGGVCSDDQRLCVDGVAGVYCAAGLDAERMPKAALSEPRDPATGNALNAAPQFTYDPSPRWANLTLDLDCGAAAAPVAWSIAAAEQQGWLIMPTSGIVDCSQSRDMRWLLDANGSNAQEGARMVDISIVGSASTPQNVAFDTTFNVQVWRASGDDSAPQAVTVASATVHSTHWYCRAGLYWDKLQGVCMACGDLPGGASGLRCSAPGATLSYLPVQPGFWVPPDAPLRVLACRSDKVCIGGNGLDTSTLCHEGNTGPYCSLCEDGFAPGMYNVCHACTNSSKATAAALIALVAVIILVLAAVGLVVLLGLTSHFAAVNDVWDCSGMVSTFVRIAREMDWGKFKIPLVAFQIISQFPQITGIEYPPVLARFLAALNVLNLNLGWWLSATCLLEANFYQQLLLATLTPLCVTAVLVATYFARRAVLLRRAAGHGERLGGDASIEEHLRRARSQHLAVIVILSFVIFSTVNTLLFQTFVCDSLGSSTPDATSYLRADYSLQCDTSEHSAYMVYSSCMIFIYAVGTPALFLGLILRHRRAMRQHQHTLTLDSDRGECAEDPRREPEGFQTEGSGMGEATAAAYESRVIRFLTSQYTPQRDYYEVVECCRRLVLTGLLVFIPASVQVETACAFAVLSLALCALLQPYRDLFDYSAAILAGIIVFLSFYIALMGQFVANSGTGVLSHLVVTLSVVLLVVAFMQCLIAAQAVRSSVQVIAKHSSRLSLRGTWRNTESRLTGLSAETVEAPWYSRAYQKRRTPLELQAPRRRSSSIVSTSLQQWIVEDNNSDGGSGCPVEPSSPAAGLLRTVGAPPRVAPSR